MLSSYRGSSRLLLCVLRLAVQCLAKPWALRGILLTALVVFLVHTLIPLLNGTEVTVVLRSGFPVVVNLGDTYPNILGKDVSEMISPELHHDVATR